MFLNIITFLLTTYFYYNSIAPKLSYDILSDSSKYETYMKKRYVSLAIYFLLILIVQFFINTYAITSNCGGVLTENLSAAAVLTFLPWSLIFGVVVMVLTIFPGFKGVFSDVIGYYSVSKKANSLLTDLLINKNIEKSLSTNGKSRDGAGTTTSSLPSSVEAQPIPGVANTNTNIGDSIATTNELSGGMQKQNGGNKNEKQRLEDAADAIVKICGNTSILINQIVPSNFAKYWTILDPLMKPKYRNNSDLGIGMRDQLFTLTVQRDTIGESIWFIYTGILIASIVQMKIATRGCQSNLQAMEQKYQQYQQEEQKELTAKAQLNETEYTITN